MHEMDDLAIDICKSTYNSKPLYTQGKVIHVAIPQRTRPTNSSPQNSMATSCYSDLSLQKESLMSPLAIRNVKEVSIRNKPQLAHS
jgi:hypothetical protein